jgi:hypothetical protein
MRRKWYKNNKEHCKAYDRGRSEIDKDKRIARHLVAQALINGTLTKKPCEVCGKIEVQSHHPDYTRSKALDVKWLCITHHKRLHVQLKKLL